MVTGFEQLQCSTAGNITTSAIDQLELIVDKKATTRLSANGVFFMQLMVEIPDRSRVSEHMDSVCSTICMQQAYVQL